MSSLRTLFLDGAGVVLETTPWLERFTRAAEMLSLHAELSDVLRASEIVRDRHQHHWSRVMSPSEEELLQLERYVIVLEELGIPDPGGSLKTQLHEACFWLNHTRLFPEVREVLRALAKRGVHIGLISNAPPSMNTALEKLGIAAFFQTVVTSNSVGLFKPDPAIYRLALRRSGASPPSTMFVDDQEQHALGACNIGMWGVLMDRSGSQTGATCTRVRDLHEVNELLSQQRTGEVDP